MPELNEIRSRFAGDRFATEAAGAAIREAEPGRAVCVMPIRPVHLNANSVPMGGAVFTLADFAFAVAANGFSDRITVTQQVSVSFLSAARGSTLIAEARCLKAGRTTCLYAVEVTDDLGAKVAYLTVNGYTVGAAPGAGKNPV
ncbi:MULTISPECIES: PaaI family thioesterase [unclassified Flavonifractor]|uniref:PaaI family thioesterase n=1 Tax=unclassified Flavonifractor TaxID=2629267 RepID=UPI000B3A1A00|nr:MULTISPECIES: PaaI family thioesterase [unclassified Flavonifractor]OUN12996.1 hypothetical protein B5G40_01870 [Flavonifractor sp. An9]OUO17605.1 hypothetical protein B5F94_01170 [Flavonifractor sp. An4]